MSSYLSAGDSGRLGTEWSVQNARRNALQRYYGVANDGEKLDFDSALIMMGIDDEVVLDKIEFNVLGFDKKYGGDLLEWSSSAWSDNTPDDRLFQGSGKDLFTNIDFNNGTYKVLDERSMTEDLGMDWSGGKPYDVLEVKNNRINFYDFVFAGTDDGSQKNVVFNLNELTSARWGINKYNIREVNTDLAYQDKIEGDYESSLAHDTLRIIKASIPSWMTASIAKELSKYEEGTDEYNKKFIELAFELMDQEGYMKGNELPDPQA